MWETILTSIILSAATAILGGILKGVQAWVAIEKQKAELQADTQAKVDAYQALEVGVAETQKEFVELAKKVAEDGKLTKDEIKQAQQLAKQKALQVATGPAVSILLGMASEMVFGLIDVIVGKNKVAKMFFGE